MLLLAQQAVESEGPVDGGWLFVLILIGMLFLMVALPAGIVVGLVFLVRHVDRAGKPRPVRPAPGWYLDGSRPGLLRYWNGLAWTPHVWPPPNDAS